MARQKSIVVPKKKKKSGIELFKDNCRSVVERGILQKELFQKVDDLLSYSLSNSFMRGTLIQQLVVLDSEEFAWILMFCLDSYDAINIVEFLNEADIDQDLYSNLRFLVAKYGPKYDQLSLMDGNEYGWRHVRSSVIERYENIYLLEVLVYLYNGSVITIRDDAESMLQLASALVEGVSRINKVHSIEKQPLVDLSESINKLLEDIEQ